MSSYPGLVPICHLPKSPGVKLALRLRRTGKNWGCELVVTVLAPTPIPEEWPYGTDRTSLGSPVSFLPGSKVSYAVYALFLPSLPTP